MLHTDNHFNNFFRVVYGVCEMQRQDVWGKKKCEGFVPCNLR